MLIILAETAHGWVRNVFFAPAIGDLRARQVGVLVGSLLILAIAWLTARWMDARTLRRQLFIGGVWVVLTVGFEIVLGRALGLGWDRILSDYNPARGGFMLAGLVVLFLAPWLTRRRT